MPKANYNGLIRNPTLFILPASVVVYEIPVLSNPILIFNASPFLKLNTIPTEEERGASISPFAYTEIGLDESPLCETKGVV